LQGIRTRSAIGWPIGKVKDHTYMGFQYDWHMGRAQ
jgi:hypothetical protein